MIEDKEKNPLDEDTEYKKLLTDVTNKEEEKYYGHAE